VMTDEMTNNVQCTIKGADSLQGIFFTIFMLCCVGSFATVGSKRWKRRKCWTFII
jgi:hypothetical protein